MKSQNIHQRFEKEIVIDIIFEETNKRDFEIISDPELLFTWYAINQERKEAYIIFSDCDIIEERNYEETFNLIQSFE